MQKTLRFSESLAAWIDQQASADQRKFAEWVVLELEKLKQRAERGEAVQPPKSRPSRKPRG